MMKNPARGERWYRVPFVWLVVTLPLISVVASFVSLALAIRSDDGLVEDDYYKRGMEINRVLDRDRAAATHGLMSALDLDAAQHELRLRLSARQPMVWPANVKLKLMHATRAGLDQTVVLARAADGTYRMPLPALAPGHWDVQLEAQDWRLTGSLYVPGDPHLVMRPGAPWGHAASHCMPAELTLVSAFLVGLLGSTHCIGMCGGIVGALTLGLHDDIRRSPIRLFPYLAAYNLGRIAAYTVAGAVLGAVSAQILNLAPPAQVRLIVKLVTGGFMIALGLYLAGWWPGLSALERLGGRLWKRIEPFGRRFLPINNPFKALALGFVWGWLPCGLVYSALAWSLTTGDAGHSAALMAAFGLGTLPMLLVMGTAARWLGNLVRQTWVRRGAGILILVFGVYALLAPGGHAGHGAMHMHDDASMPTMSR